MAAKTRGRCTRCQREFTKAGMHRHLEACTPAASKPTLHLVVDAGPYWLHLAGAPDLRLEELDAFLRAYWLECCGHLSSFVIGDRLFCAEGERIAHFGASSTRTRLAPLLPPGASCRYTYDLGTPTELLIKRRDFAPALPSGARLAVLARNLSPPIPCDQCDEHAVELCVACELALCVDCAHEHAEDKGCEDHLLPLLDSPRTGVCGYTGPAGGFTRWPLQAEPRGAPVDEPTRSIIDGLMAHPPADEDELMARAGSLAPERLAALLLARLERGEGGDWLLPALTELLGTRGIRAEQRRLLRIAEDGDLPPAARNAALALLITHAPEAVEHAHELNGEAMEPLLREGMRDVLALALEDAAGPALLADLLEQTEPEARPVMLALLRELRLEEGVPAAMIYRDAARRPALADVRSMFVEAFAQEGGAAAVAALEDLLADAKAPDEQRDLQHALLRARTATIERPALDEALAGAEEGEDFALVSSCDGEGAYFVAACQRGVDGRYRMSVVVIRATQGIRDGWVRTGLSRLDIEEVEEFIEDDADVLLIRIPLACAAALVAEGVAISRATSASLPREAAAPLAIFGRLGRSGEVPVPEIEPSDTGFDGCLWLLSCDEYTNWVFDQGDLEPREIPPPPGSASPPATERCMASAKTVPVSNAARRCWGSLGRCSLGRPRKMASSAKKPASARSSSARCRALGVPRTRIRPRRRSRRPSSPIRATRGSRRSSQGSSLGMLCSSIARTRGSSAREWSGSRRRRAAASHTAACSGSSHQAW